MIIEIYECDRDYHDSVFSWTESVEGKAEADARIKALDVHIGKDYFYTVVCK